jgi:hypothetical protein
MLSRLFDSVSRTDAFSFMSRAIASSSLFSAARSRRSKEPAPTGREIARLNVSHVLEDLVLQVFCQIFTITARQCQNVSSEMRLSGP